MLYKIKLAISGCSIAALSGCTIAPGMHMNNYGFTPTPNAQGEVISPKLVHITAKLILDQKKADKEKLAIEQEAYVSPKGYSSNTSAYDYRVGPGDSLDVRVYKHPELDPIASITSSANSGALSSTLKVNSKGFIYYPYVGYVSVQGDTTDEIRQELTVKLSQEIKNPQINVQVSEYKNQQVSVTGQVQNPSTLGVSDTPLTVLSAVGQAKPIECSSQEQICADLNHVKVTQNGVTSIVDLSTLSAVNGSSTNWILSGGAVVYVPDNSLYQIYMVGGTNRAGAYRMLNDKMTLREAIGRSGGAASVSDPGFTYVIRNFKHEPKIYMLNMRSPDALNIAGEFDLMPQDVVFISTSKLQSFNEVLNQVTPTLTTIALIKSISE
jgi:polysaccharide export outer membrane protein